MAKELTEAEYRQIVQKPRRRFETLAVADAGVSLRQPVVAPCYWFERNDVAEEPSTGKYWRDPNLATVSMVVDGKTSALFYLVGRRLDTCTFAYDLTPAQLKRAVTAMRRASLQQLIRPAAEWALREMPAQRRPVLAEALHAVLRSKGARTQPSARRRRTKR